jgi:AbrB family looped-hinge helix DNA binding protein
MKASKLSEKGWVVIPNSIRKRYGLKKGDQVNIIDYGNIISIIPLSTDPIKESAGLLKGGSSLTKDLI